MINIDALKRAHSIILGELLSAETSDSEDMITAIAKALDNLETVIPKEVTT